MKNINIIKTLPVGLLAALASVANVQVNAAEEPANENPPMREMRQNGMRGHQGGKMHKNADPGRHLLRIADRLELSDDQEIEILKTSQEFEKQMKANRESAKEVKASLREMRKSGSFDEDAFRQSMEALQPTLIDGMVMRAKYKEALAEILTDEQKTKLEKLKKNLRKRGQNSKEKGKGRGGRENRKERHGGNCANGDC